MACPICDYTMDFVPNGGFDSLYWCPRCGTQKLGMVPIGDTSNINPVKVPTLVVQCRTLLDQYKKDVRITELLRLFSITESVTKESEQCQDLTPTQRPSSAKQT